MPEQENQNLGSEVGRRFKIGDDAPSHLTEFKFFIKDNNFVDLTPFGIIVKEDVIVSVEWIEHSENGDTLNLPIIIPSFSSTHFYKLGSQNRWEKYGNMSSSMNLTYEQ